MAKVHFYYSAMNAGKSSTLLQASYNYQERGMRTCLFLPDFVHEATGGYIASRIGIQHEAIAFDRSFNFENYLSSCTEKPHCLLIDEAQFLMKQQVYELSKIADQLNIPVLAYGLRSDFRAEPFEGSQYLLVMADVIQEIKTICFCGSKATMNLRLDDQGQVLRAGAQIELGGNERYLAVCRKHFFELDQLPSALI